MINAVTNHLWQSTVFAIGVGLLTLAFRKNRAQVRYWLWFSASLKFLIPFSLLLNLGGFLGRSPAAKSLAVPGVTYRIVRMAEPLPQSPALVPSEATHRDWLPIALVSIWACGLGCVALIRLRGWLRIRAAVRSSIPVDMMFPVEVRCVPATLEPGIVGFFRPMLLIPAGIVDRLAANQLQAVLAHELCHLRRRDNLTAAIHMVVEAVFWFHPLIWWISSRLIAERERACDEEVLESGAEPQAYAETILKTCQFYVESPLTCVPGVTGADLKKRIVRIMTQVGRTKLNFSRKLLLAGFALGAVLGPLVLGLKVAPRVWAQNSQSGSAYRPAFEVASIKPDPGCQKKQPQGGTFTPSPDRIEIPCVNLKRLIMIAYGTFADGVMIDPQELHVEGGPSWMQSEDYSVSAKADAPPAHPQMMLGPMLRALLEERFRLKTHREPREMPVYAMTVAKGGLKLQPLAEVACTPMDLLNPAPAKPGDLPCGVPLIRPTGTGDMRLDILGSTMTQFAQGLSRLAGRTVTDKTGIEGQFNFHLEFTPDPGMLTLGPPGMRPPNGGSAANPSSPQSPTGSGPDLFVGLREQIGLKLSSEKAPVSVLIIDHVEKPTAN
ncbi:MAG: M56 family metallopeptidase [Terriglobia bacterium]|jgi:uncharacterized protein (TIGR03435 family)